MDRMIHFPCVLLKTKLENMYWNLHDYTRTFYNNIGNQITFIDQKIIAYLHPVRYITVTCSIYTYDILGFFTFSKFKGY